MSRMPHSLPTVISPYIVPIARYPYPIPVISGAIITVRIRVIGRRGCRNYWRADKDWRK